MKKIYAIIAYKKSTNKIWLRAFNSKIRLNKYVSRLPYNLDKLGLYEMEYDDEKTT